MRFRRTAAVFLIASTACYHQIVQTGQPAGATTIHKEWVNGWLWGLVPPDPIDVSAQCPSGFATVETQMSVANALATIFTLGIYSPRDVTIQCASRETALRDGLRQFAISPDSPADERNQIVREAVALSASLGEPVVLRLK